MPRRQRRRLVDELARVRPDVTDPAALVEAGRVLVDGTPIGNPNSQVRPGASIVIRAEPSLRGSAKLSAALAQFGVVVDGRVCLDCGAAAGGFTRVLLDQGARLVYAVDAGHGQLLGSLRQDPRVVNLEGVNLADVQPAEPVDLVTLDLSYLSLADAVHQLRFGSELIALVKPMFELHLDHAPTDDASLSLALERAGAGMGDAGWSVAASMESPVTGAKGAREALLHAFLSRRPAM